MSEHREPVVQLESRVGRPGAAVLERLRVARATRGGLTAADVDRVAAELDLPRAHVNGAAAFYADLGFDGAEAPEAVRVCAGTACLASGASQNREGRRVYCLGYCYAAPAALMGEQPLTGHRAEPSDPPIPYEACVPEPVVLARLAGAGPDAWTVWPQVLAGGGAARVQDEVKRSRLRGRGGAGFPVAVKWSTAVESAGDGPRYVIANGDEGDPGSYVDRLLMESDPDGVLEGMALAALAVGANRGYVYVRSEYPRARDRMRAAIERARAAGHLGSDVHASGFDFDVEVFEGAGSYVAGEETSLIHSMEGLRGGTVPRPPFPARRGLYNAPTVVNNVETLASLPWILAQSGDAYAALGRGRSRGTKVVCLNERFARPGAYEVELGSSVAWICAELGGGLRDGRPLRALQVGGPLGGFLGPGELDVPLTFEDLAAAGVDMGHGSLVGFDDGVEPGAILRHIWRFLAEESCGTCLPCRIGTRRGLELSEPIASGTTSDEQQALQEELLETMGQASLCAFGRGAPTPVRSLMRIFPELRGEPAP